MTILILISIVEIGKKCTHFPSKCWKNKEAQIIFLNLLSRKDHLKPFEFIFLLFIYSHLKGRKRNKENEWVYARCFIYWLTFQVPTMARSESGHSQGLSNQFRFPTCAIGIWTLGPSSAASHGVHQKAGIRRRPRTWTPVRWNGMWASTWHLTCCTKFSPSYSPISCRFTQLKPCRQ